MQAAAAVRIRVKGTGIYLAQAADPFVSTRPVLDYNAAGRGRRLSNWMTSGAGPNAALLGSLSVLRDRSRDAVRKNTYAAAAVEQIVSNVVGSGIKPQSTATSGDSKAAKKRDASFRKAAHEVWADWTDEADADGRTDFYGLQALLMRSVATAGEVFVRIRTRRADDGLTVPLQLQVIEAEQCPLDKNEMAPNGNVIRAGIEFDAIGRRVAYWIYPRHPGDGSTDTSLAPNAPVRVPAADVLHLFLPVRPGQLRGEPWLTRALIKIRSIENYDDAEVARKETAALLVGVVTRSGEEGEPVIPEKPSSDPQEAAAGIADATMEPGTIQYLEPGEEIEFNQPADVGGNYEAFLRWQGRMIATAIGILYEELTGDYSGGNDRTLRAALIAFRRRVAMWQHHLVVFQFCRPVWQRFLDLAVFSGALSWPDRRNDTRPFYRAKWLPESWPYLHPVQDVQSDLLQVQAGFATRSQKVSERGYDPDQVDDEQAADNARADEQGLKYTSDGRQKAVKPDAPVKSETDEERPEAA